MSISKKTIHLIIVTVLLACIGAVILVAFLQQEKKQFAHSLPEYADMMLKKCEDAPHRPTCYEQEVPKLVSDLPTTEIFSVIRLIRNEDPEYLYCHVLAHELGSYEVSRDPNNWLDVIATGPTDGLCSNGYAHGALVTRFNDEDLSPEEYAYALEDIAIACERRKGFEPTDLTKAICYHGIGHVLIHMTLADVPQSLEGCDYVGKKEDGSDYTMLCTEGVYMQLFQPLEPEDYALVDMLPEKPTRENLATFCEANSSSDAQYGACWREGWPFFGEEIYDSEGLTAYCGHLTEAQDKDYCYQTAFTINGRQHLGDAQKLADVCNGLEDAYQGDCFARSANAYPEEDPNLVDEAIALCGKAESPRAQDTCYTFLARVASFNFHEDSEPFEVLCSSLPAKYESTCRGR